MSTQECMQQVLRGVDSMRQLFLKEIGSINRNVANFQTDVQSELKNQNESMVQLREEFIQYRSAAVPPSIGGEYHSVSSLSRSHSTASSTGAIADETNSYVQLYDLHDEKWAEAITLDRLNFLNDFRAMAVSMNDTIGLEWIATMRLLAHHITPYFFHYVVFRSALSFAIAENNFELSESEGKMINSNMTKTFTPTPVSKKNETRKCAPERKRFSDWLKEYLKNFFNPHHPTKTDDYHHIKKLFAITLTKAIFGVGKDHVGKFFYIDNNNEDRRIEVKLLIRNFDNLSEGKVNCRFLHAVICYF